MNLKKKKISNVIEKLLSINPRNWNEKKLESITIKKLKNLGYHHSLGKEINRSYLNNKDLIIFKDLQKYLSTKFIPTDIIEKIIQKFIQSFSNNINSDFLLFRNYIFEGIEINQQKVFLIDYKNIENNQFRVVNQLVIANPINKNKTSRPDILVYINGFPLICFELKTPKTMQKKKIDDGTTQIFERYFKNITQLFRFVQMAIISNQWSTIVAVSKDKRWERLFMNSIPLIWLIKKLFIKDRLLIYLRDYLYQIDNNLRKSISPLQALECEKINQSLIKKISIKNKIIKVKIYSNFSNSDKDSPMIISKKISKFMPREDWAIIYLLEENFRRIIAKFETNLKEFFGGFINWDTKSFSELQSKKVYISDIKNYLKNSKIELNFQIKIIIMFHKEDLFSCFTKEKIREGSILSEKNIKQLLKQFKKETPLVVFYDYYKKLISFRKIVWIIKKFLFWPVFQFSKFINSIWDIYWKSLKWWYE